MLRQSAQGINKIIRTIIIINNNIIVVIVVVIDFYLITVKKVQMPVGNWQDEWNCLDQMCHDYNYGGKQK